MCNRTTAVGYFTELVKGNECICFNCTEFVSLCVSSNLNIVSFLSWSKHLVGLICSSVTESHTHTHTPPGVTVIHVFIMAYDARFYSICVQADRNRWCFFFAWRVQTKLLVNQPSVKLGQRSPLNTPKLVCPAWFHTSTQWPVNFTSKPLKEISWRRQGLKTHVFGTVAKKQNNHSHHIFHEFQTTERLPVCPHVLHKLFEVDLLHGCTFFF